MLLIVTLPPLAASAALMETEPITAPLWLTSSSPESNWFELVAIEAVIEPAAPEFAGDKLGTVTFTGVGVAENAV
jgi:hypothetical protein